jgi:hypothetical protein
LEELFGQDVWPPLTRIPNDDELKDLLAEMPSFSFHVPDLPENSFNGWVNCRQRSNGATCELVDCTVMRLFPVYGSEMDIGSYIDSLLRFPLEVRLLRHFCAFISSV